MSGKDYTLNKSLAVGETVEFNLVCSYEYDPESMDNFGKPYAINVTGPSYDSVIGNADHPLKVEHRKLNHDGHGNPYFFLAHGIKGTAKSFDVILGEGIVDTEEFGSIKIYSDGIKNFNSNKVVVENKWNRSVKPGEELRLNVVNYRQWCSVLKREVVSPVAVNVTALDGGEVIGHEVQYFVYLNIVH